MKEFNEFINKEKTSVSFELFQKHFNFKAPILMLKTLYYTDNEKESSILVNAIKIGLKYLKDEIKEMSEDEIKTEKPDKIVDIVERILEFNNQNQKGGGLKILTPDQMLSRLAISLAQLKAGNNSEET